MQLGFDLSYLMSAVKLFSHHTLENPLHAAQWKLFILEKNTLKVNLPTSYLHTNYICTDKLFAMLGAILKSPGDNTPQDTNYSATYLPSRKLYKLDEPDTQDTAGEGRTSS